jgi:hypothetical protein
VVDHSAAKNPKIEELKAECESADLSDEPHLEYALSQIAVAELFAEGDWFCVGIRGSGKDVVIAPP